MQAEQELDRVNSDAKYFDQHRQDLLERYPDRWVAVYDGQVVGAARDITGLIRQLEKKGIQPGRAYREYVTEREELLILRSSW